MNYDINIIPYTTEKNLLLVNKKFLTKLSFENKARVYISFGSKKCYAEIHESEDIDEDTISLSSNLIEELHLPNYIDFKLKAKENELLLGPYIGILLYKDSGKFKNSTFKSLSLYTLNYKNLGGAIVAFSLDKIDKINGLIEGFCFNPKENTWEKGIFPYPLAIYRRIGLNSSWKDYFLSSIGDKVYNSYYFNKWEMYRWLSKFHTVQDHLPYTTLYNTPQDILDLLKEYNKLLIKPISGMQGNGIVQIYQKDEGLEFSYRRNRKNEQIFLVNEEEILLLIKSLFNPKKYIIQSCIDILKQDDSVIDFRIIMQKDSLGKWVCNGTVSRVGAKESIVSNVSNSGEALLLEELLRKLFSSSEIGIFLFKEKLISLSYRICSCIDECGLVCGTLGLDLCVDNKGKLWLIEINNRDPDPTIALDAKDSLLYYKLKSSTLLYGKFLSGFSP